MKSTHACLGRQALVAAGGTLAVAAFVAMAPVAAAGATDATPADFVVHSLAAPTDGASATVAPTGGSLVAADPQVGAVVATSTDTEVATTLGTTKGAGGTASPGPLASALTPIGLDIVAILVLVFGLYLPRHHRRDLVVAFLGVNVGVMAVSAALLDSAATAGLGLGLGLFGVLSIIRLRSDELVQHEVAYYFSALALGLLGGVSVSPIWLGATLMAAILLALWLGDNPRLLPRSRRQLMVLDRAFDQETAMIAHLEERLGATVQGVNVQRVDHVNDSTWVEVRFRLPKGTGPLPTTPAVPPTAHTTPGLRSETDTVATAGLNDHVRGGVV